MTTNDARKLRLLASQLSENLMSAALCAKEIGQIAHSESDDSEVPTGALGHGHNGTAKRPLLDESTLSVIWNGKTLHLGHTQGFWLLDRLARHANVYVTHLDLLREIWDDEFADAELLRAGMKRLRGKLRQGGMADLAEALTGHHGRYMLDLTRAKCHREVPAMSHRMSQA